MTENTEITKGRKQKITEVTEIVENLDKAKSVVFTQYHGLDASQISDLRSNLRDKGARTKIIKNTLLKLALKDKNLMSEELEETLNGPTMAVFAFEDAVDGVKSLFEFSDTHEALVIKGGLFEGQFANFNKLEILSNLPSREQLLAQTVGGLKSPLFGLVNTLGGVQRNFVYAISAIAEKKKDN